MAEASDFVHRNSRFSSHRRGHVTRDFTSCPAGLAHVPSLVPILTNGEEEWAKNSMSHSFRSINRNLNRKIPSERHHTVLDKAIVIGITTGRIAHSSIVPRIKISTHRTKSAPATRKKPCQLNNPAVTTCAEKKRSVERCNGVLRKARTIGVKGRRWKTEFRA